MAASTRRKFFLPVFFTYSIRVNRTPELPEMNRPGSIRIRKPSGLSSGTSRTAYFSGVRMLFAAEDCHHDSGPLAENHHAVTRRMSRRPYRLELALTDRDAQTIGERMIGLGGLVSIGLTTLAGSLLTPLALPHFWWVVLVDAAYVASYAVVFVVKFTLLDRLVFGRGAARTPATTSRS